MYLIHTFMLLSGFLIVEVRMKNGGVRERTDVILYSTLCILRSSDSRILNQSEYNELLTVLKRFLKKKSCFFV